MLRAERSERCLPSVCFVGLSNLSVLAPHIDRRGAAGEPVQQSLLAKALARRGYATSTIVSDCGQPDGEVFDGVRAFKAFAPNAGLPVLRFLHPRFTGLWSALKRANADVYYVSCAGAIVGQVALFCQRHGKRFVYRVASDADCAPDTLLIEFWRDRRLYEYGLRRASRILVQSGKQQQLLERNYGLSSVIAGLMVERAAESAPFEGRDIDVLWVSNIKSLKRPDLLLALASALRERSFHMVGGVAAGEAHAFEDAKRRAATLPNVTFHGAVPYREAAALFRRAKVFVNTSDIEGFPNTYLQAWSSGAPVVAFFDPDHLIARESLGAAATSLEHMARAVENLATDAAAWTAASARGLAFMERVFRDDVVLEPYLRAFAREELTSGGLSWASP